MATEDNDDSRSVALYWDFENLHAGLMEAKYGEGTYAKQDNRFKVQEPLVDVQALVEFGASFGPVAINRAYGNWQYFGRYRDALLQSAVELIQLFPPGARQLRRDGQGHGVRRRDQEGRDGPSAPRALSAPRTDGLPGLRDPESLRARGGAAAKRLLGGWRRGPAVPARHRLQFSQNGSSMAACGSSPRAR